MARKVRAKPGELVAAFGKHEAGGRPDIAYAWGGGGADKPDARILSNALEQAPVHMGRTLRQELVARGYDISTLRFSVRKLVQTEAGGA